MTTACPWCHFPWPQAADSLISRFEPMSGMVRSWDNEGNVPATSVRVIIDSVMNMELLLVASKLPGGKRVSGALYS